MKKNLLILTLPLFFACSQPKETKEEPLETINEVAAPLPDCKNKESFGSLSICLPEIAGMNECHSHPKVMEKIEALNPNGTIILGYYVNDSVYKAINQMKDFSYDDYFQIYSIEQMKNMSIKPSDFSAVIESMKSGYTQEDWDSFRKKHQKKYSEFEIGVPKMMDTYLTEGGVNALVLLTKIKSEDSEQLILVTLNLLLLGDKLVIGGYYKSYTGDKSVAEAKAKNDIMVAAFMKAN